MELLFWIGQVVCLAMLVCGAYVAFSFYELSDPGRARTVRPAKPATRALPSDDGHAGLMADGI